MLNTWYLSRSTGLVAYGFLWLSICIGLLQASGWLKGITSASSNIDVHQFTALTGLNLTVFHAVVLLWNPHVTFTWRDLLLPFGGGYKPVLVGLGSLAVYLILLAILTTYFRSKFSPTLWRVIHLISLVGFAAALIHGLLLGTDSAAPIVGMFYRFTGLSVAALAVYRLYRRIPERARADRRG